MLRSGMAMQRFGGSNTLLRGPLGLIVLSGLVVVLALLGGLSGSASADPTYGVMNAEGGIYWRSAPDWNTPEAIAGNGFYPNTIISVHCYQSGAANVPGSADSMWEQATDVGGSGSGSGWINEHFINDGQPINEPSPGVPPCGVAPTPPAPPSAPSPPPATSGGLVFTVFNAEGGIYYRNSPQWSDTSSTPGVGVYNGDQVELICGAFGDAVGPYNDTAWSYVNNLSRSVGDGWVNEHFINDGALSNQFVSGEPMCGPSTPGLSGGESPGGSAGSSGSGSGGPPVSVAHSPIPGGSLYFSPYPTNDHGNIRVIGGGTAYAPSPATFTLNFDQWHPTPEKTCPNPDSTIPPGINNGVYGNRIITTLAAWSVARIAPFLFLTSSPWAGDINYILLFDPGDAKEYASSACARYNESSVLAKWLAKSSNNRLVVLAGEVTAKDHHAGIQKYLFPEVKNPHNDPPHRNIRSQVVVCNYDTIGHEPMWIVYGKWMNYAPITLGNCPPWPYHKVVSWNP
jgi:hypothetical protein